MPIRAFLNGHSFDPETVRRMSLAFEGVCAEPGQLDKTGKAREAVAKKVIELANTGERDPQQLRLAVLAWLKRGR